MLVFLAAELAFKCCAFVAVEPTGLMGPVRQCCQDDETENYSRCAPENVDPLPADQVQDPWLIPDANGHDSTTDRWADNLCDRRSDEEPSQGPRTITAGKPMGQIDDHTGIEPGLSHTQQKPHCPELKHIDGS